MVTSNKKRTRDAIHRFSLGENRFGERKKRGAKANVKEQETDRQIDYSMMT